MVADIASWRHRARVCSNPSAERRRSSSAEAMGASWVRCAWEQLPRVSPGPVQQRELDQELRPDAPGVCHWPFQPRCGGPPPGRGDLDQRADRSRAGALLSSGPDQGEQLQPLQGPVDHLPGNPAIAAPQDLFPAKETLHTHEMPGTRLAPEPSDTQSATRGR
jgi:hypothetical protein